MLEWSSDRRRLVLPAVVAFKQATLLLADSGPDPVLEQGLAGTALEQTRERQVVRQAGPRQHHLVHHPRLFFHLLHSEGARRANGGAGAAAGAASEEQRGLSRRRRREPL